MCIHNEKGDPELSPCTSAGVDGEEVHMDIRGENWLLASGGKWEVMQKGQILHLLILEDLFPSAV